jgi:predicted oxidoreductase (fatty acid repression mutant protein)
MDQEQVLTDLQREFVKLKDQFSKLGKMRGIPGPTGPAGDIHAAVINATETAERVAVVAAKKAIVYPFEAKVAELRQEFEALKTEFTELTERIENAVVIHVVQTLKDYGVLDENMNPLNKAHIESHLKSLGLLKN